ncbi:disulfide reductase [SAR202 cluster bacterium AD-804-J14_MRT_500m]|nr:disulfide reductase [SAR202 cluster bacterium AD-804-J14_MRT_500m]
MKFAFFPGCVSRGGCPELYPATIKVCQQLGFELDELQERGATCTGAGVLQEKNQFLGDTLNARTFAIAEQIDLPLMTICSTCQGVMSQANRRLTTNPEYLARVNSNLAEEGLEYRGTVKPRHLLWVIIEEIGIESLKSMVVRPLTNLKLAPFYGCYMVRPSDALEFRLYPEREDSLERVMEALGAQVVDYPGKTRCCGFPILTINEQNSVAMVANHTGTAKDLGADAMVTPCPLCHLNLDGYQPKAMQQADRGINLPIIHLPQLIGIALGFDAKEMGLSRHIISAKQVMSKVAVRG